MTDADVFAKLSRIIETQDFSDPDVSKEPLEDVLKGLADSSVKKNNDDENENQGKERVGFVDSPSKAKSKPKDDGDYYTRPTPYEVWKAEQDAKFRFKNKQTKHLSEAQWDELVGHLHKTNKIKESALMKEQNQGLAAELDGLSFKPQMNTNSLQLASTMKSLQHRLPGMISKRDSHLKKRKDEIEKAEMEPCTFTPNRAGAKMSEKYLNRMGRGRVTPDDFFQYHQEKLKRNEQRRQIIDEIESKELTFKPLSNSRSQKIQERMAQKKNVITDPQSRVTVAVRREHVSRTSVETAEENQTFGKPSVTEIGHSYGKDHDKPVHDRLYQRAVEQNIKKHNAQVEQLTSKLNVSLFPWETQKRSPRVQNTWTMNKSHFSKTNLNFEHCLDDVNRPVMVVEYDESVSSIWKALRNVEPSKQFTSRHGRGDDSTSNPTEL